MKGYWYTLSRLLLIGSLTMSQVSLYAQPSSPPDNPLEAPIIATSLDSDQESDLATKVYLPLIIGIGQEETRNEDTTVTMTTSTDQLVVRFKPEVQAATVDRVTQVAELSAIIGFDLTYVRDMADSAIVIKLAAWMNETEVRSITDAIRVLPEVDYAEPDAIMQPMKTPNDPHFGSQWHYFAPIAGTYGANLPAAWDMTTGSANIVVAVLDTGILNHADLTGRTVAGYDFISESAIANDGNGRDNNPTDPGNWVTQADINNGGFCAGQRVSHSSWHGTHVAGTIAAGSNNGVGVAGVNWQSKILPVRVLGKCGGYVTDFADAIYWSAGLSVNGVPANANRAHVINMSLGGPGACSQTYQNAINAAVGAGTVIVVSAGNSNSDAIGFQPANCPNVLTVGATDRNGNRARYSNYGQTVEISAPGGDTSTLVNNGVLSTLNTGTTISASDTYTYFQGTSMAAPHVAGIASLLLSLNPNLTPAQVTTVLQTTATAFPGSCTPGVCGAGIINAAAAIQSLCYPEYPTLPVIFGTTGNDTNLRGTASSERICGLIGNDSIYGSTGNDAINGNQGRDTVNGEAGNDTLKGGQDNDTVNGGDGDDTVYGDLGDDTLNGNIGNDYVAGGDGNDTVRGGQGNDTVIGDVGNDVLYGDKGNDSLWGGTEIDYFEYIIGDGNDTIHDFQWSIDRLRLYGVTIQNYTQLGADCQVNLSTGATIRLVNVGTCRTPTVTAATTTLNTAVITANRNAFDNTITVYGHGFGSNELVIIVVEAMSLPSIQADANGDFVYTFQGAESISGEYLITVPAYSFVDNELSIEVNSVAAIVSSE